MAEPVEAEVEPAPVPAEAAAEIAAPTRTGGATTALIVAATTARSRPGAGRAVLRLRTATDWSGQPQTLLVLGSRTVEGEQWLRVLLPIRPAGRSAWIPRDVALLDHTDVWLQLRLRTRILAVYRGGRLTRRYRAVVGKPSTPTPRGLAAIYERNRQPDPKAFLGPWALSLTALSDVITDFGGGPGRIAIHGRGAGSLVDPLGSARSHGCVRIDNAPIRWLAAQVGRGTPVEIR